MKAQEAIRRSNLLRRGAIIVYTGNKLLQKGQIGKIITKEGDTVFSCRFQKYVEMPKDFYGIYYNGLTSITFNNIPIVLIPVSNIRYAYSYEKLLRRRGITISPFENLMTDLPESGTILIKKINDMTANDVISGIWLVKSISKIGEYALLNIVTKGTIYIDNTILPEYFRELNDYEIRKLNRYGKTIGTNG